MSMRVLVVVGLVAAVFCLAPVSARATGLSRDEVMERELSCIKKSQVQGRSLDWGEVCYTHDRPDFFAQQRQDAIVSALDREERMASGKQNKPAAFAGSSPASGRPSAAGFSPSGSFSPEPPVRESDESFWRRVKQKIADSRSERTTYEMGFESSRIRYAEPSIMREKGSMHGVFLNYTHRTQENTKMPRWGETFSADSSVNMVRLEGRYNWGEVFYKSEETGTISNIPDKTLEIRGVAGYDLPVTATVVVTPYLGVGFRHLEDDFGGMRSTTGHYGYRRESDYYYVPVGVETAVPLAGRWSSRLTLEFDYLVRGKQQSHLENVAPGFENLKNEQREGFGLRGAMRLMLTGTYVDLFAEPFVRYWEIKDSKATTLRYTGIAVGSGIEPENNSTEYGLRFGAMY